MTSTLSECRKCPDLVKSRRTVVHGIGAPDAEIMFLGMCPGQHGANQTNIPFVGDISGDAFLKELAKLDFNSIYITNVVKCSPPGNRSPEPEEIQACRHHLYSELVAVNPKLVVAIGAIALRVFSNGSVVMLNGARIKGKLPCWEGEVIPIVHPAYCARLNNFNMFERGFSAVAQFIWRSGLR